MLRRGYDPQPWHLMPIGEDAPVGLWRWNFVWIAALVLLVLGAFVAAVNPPAKRQATTATKASTVQKHAGASPDRNWQAN